MKRSQFIQCNKEAPSQRKEPLITTPCPEYPFEQVAIDLCYLAGHHYLVFVDRYSGWIEIEKMKGTSIRDVRRELLNWFKSFGVPAEIATDGGPPFNSMEYAQFLKDWDIHARLSSAHYAQSNGRAEAAVKTAKRILLGNTCPTTGKLNTYEATIGRLTSVSTNPPNRQLHPT